MATATRTTLRHPRLEGRAFRTARTALGALSRVSAGAAASVAIRLFTRPGKHAARPWELECLRSSRPLGNGVPGLNAVVWGPEDGPTVVLLHGWEGRCSQMGAIALALASAGFRVVAFDAPAHGASAGQVANPLVFSRALLTLGERLGPVHAVIGHSMGGAATVIAWSRGLEVERLAVLGAPSRLSRVVLGFPSALGLNERAASRFVRYVERQAGGAVDSLDPLRLAIEVSGAAETPLLIVHDPADAEVPLSDASELAAAWPGAEFVTLDAGGHRKMLRHPGVIDAVLSHVGSAMTARRGTR